VALGRLARPAGSTAPIPAPPPEDDRLAGVAVDPTPGFPPAGPAWPVPLELPQAATASASNPQANIPLTFGISPIAFVIAVILGSREDRRKAGLRQGVRRPTRQDNVQAGRPRGGDPTGYAADLPRENTEAPTVGSCIRARSRNSAQTTRWCPEPLTKVVSGTPLPRNAATI
jgi:hypothetical protein